MSYTVVLGLGKSNVVDVLWVSSILGICLCLSFEYILYVCAHAHFYGLKMFHLFLLFPSGDVRVFFNKYMLQKS